MDLTCRRASPTLLLLLYMVARAADVGPTPPETASSPGDEGPKPATTKWEGAIGPVFAWSPAYSGASGRKVSVVPGLYLRYGRFSISNSSSFVTRRRDDVLRGLGLNLVDRDRVRVNLSLRLDRGRRSSVSASLGGIHGVRSTLRARTTATWQFAHGWKLGAGWNSDVLGHGGGQVLDLSVGHDTRLSPRLTWGVSTGVAWASRRYMRSYHGVTAEESALTGYATYTPDAGLRDVSVGTGWRMEINPRWAGFANASVGRLLGPAADSPLTAKTTSWAVGGGVFWRF